MITSLFIKREKRIFNRKKYKYKLHWNLFWEFSEIPNTVPPLFSSIFLSFSITLMEFRCDGEKRDPYYICLHEGEKKVNPSQPCA